MNDFQEAYERSYAEHQTTRRDDGRGGYRERGPIVYCWTTHDGKKGRDVVCPACCKTGEVQETYAGDSITEPSDRDYVLEVHSDTGQAFRTLACAVCERLLEEREVG